MQKRLLAVVAAGLLVGAGDPPANFNIQYDIPPGSKWVAVDGRRGDCKIMEACVTFKAGNKVEIYWKAKTQGGSCACTSTYKYQSDPDSNLPRIQNKYGFFDWEKGRFRVVGNRLELSLDECSSASSIHEPSGRLSLVLKREK